MEENIDITKGQKPEGLDGVRKNDATGNQSEQENNPTPDFTYKPSHYTTHDLGQELDYNYYEDLGNYDGGLGMRHMDYGESTYDKYAKSMDDLEDLNEVRAREQGTVSKLAGGFGRYVATTGLGTVGNIVGAVVGLGEGLYNAATGEDGNAWSRFWDGYINNTVNEFVHDSLDKVNEWMPNYRSKYEQDMGVFRSIITAGFLSDQIANLGWTSSAILSTVLTGGLGGASAASGLAKVLGASKGAQSFIYRLVGGITGAFAEASTESIDRYHEAKDAYSSQLRQQEQGLQMQMQTEIAQRYAQDGYNPTIARDENYEKLVEQEVSNRHADEINNIQSKYDGIEQNAKAAARQTFLLNEIILGATNTLGVFSNIKAPMVNAERIAKGSITNIFREKGAQIAASKGELAVREGLEMVSEGVEEISQKWAGTTAQAYYGQEYDPKYTGQVKDWMSVAGDKFFETIEDKESWKEFMAGFITGATGAGGAKRVQEKGEDGKMHSKVKFDWVGGIWSMPKDINKTNETSTEIYNQVNEVYNDKNLQRKLRLMTGSLADKDAMLQAAQEGDKNKYLTAANNQMVRTIEAFADLGQLGELRAMIGQNDNISDDELEKFVMANVVEEKDENGKPTGKYQSDSGLVDINGEPLTNTPEGKQELRERLKKNTQQVLKTIDFYNEAINKADQNTGYQLDRQTLSRFAWGMTQAELADSRAKDIISKNLDILKQGLSSPKAKYSESAIKQINKTIKNLQDELKRENKKPDSEERTNNIKALNQAIEELQDLTKEDADGKNILEALFDRGNLTLIGSALNSKVDDEHYLADLLLDNLADKGLLTDEVKRDVNDILKLYRARNNYDQMVNEWAKNPQEVKDLMDREADTIRDQQIRSTAAKLNELYKQAGISSISDFDNKFDNIAKKAGVTSENFEEVLRQAGKTNKDLILYGQAHLNEAKLMRDIAEAQNVSDAIKGTAIELLRNNKDLFQRIRYASKEQIIRQLAKGFDNLSKEEQELIEQAASLIYSLKERDNKDNTSETERKAAENESYQPKEDVEESSSPNNSDTPVSDARANNKNPIQEHENTAILEQEFNSRDDKDHIDLGTAFVTTAQNIDNLVAQMNEVSSDNLSELARIATELMSFYTDSLQFSVKEKSFYELAEKAKNAIKDFYKRVGLPNAFVYDNVSRDNAEVKSQLNGGLNTVDINFLSVDEAPDECSIIANITFEANDGFIKENVTVVRGKQIAGVEAEYNSDTQDVTITPVYEEEQENSTEESLEELPPPPADVMPIIDNEELNTPNSVQTPQQQTASVIENGFNATAEAAKQAFEERTKEIIAKQGYMEFSGQTQSSKDAIELFRKEHPDFKEEVLEDGTTRFYAPKEESTDELVDNSTSTSDLDSQMSFGDKDNIAPEENTEEKEKTQSIEEVSENVDNATETPEIPTESTETPKEQKPEEVKEDLVLGLKVQDALLWVNGGKYTKKGGKIVKSKIPAHILSLFKENNTFDYVMKGGLAEFMKNNPNAPLYFKDLTNKKHSKIKTSQIGVYVKDGSNYILIGYVERAWSKTRADYSITNNIATAVSDEKPDARLETAHYKDANNNAVYVNIQCTGEKNDDGFFTIKNAEGKYLKLNKVSTLDFMTTDRHPLKDTNVGSKSLIDSYNDGEVFVGTTLGNGKPITLYGKNETMETPSSTTIPAGSAIISYKGPNGQFVQSGFLGKKFEVSDIDSLAENSIVKSAIDSLKSLQEMINESNISASSANNIAAFINSKEELGKDFITKDFKVKNTKDGYTISVTRRGEGTINVQIAKDCSFEDLVQAFTTLKLTYQVPQSLEGKFEDFMEVAETSLDNFEQPAIPIISFVDTSIDETKQVRPEHIKEPNVVNFGGIEVRVTVGDNSIKVQPLNSNTIYQRKDKATLLGLKYDKFNVDLIETTANQILLDIVNKFKDKQIITVPDEFGDEKHIVYYPADGSTIETFFDVDANKCIDVSDNTLLKDALEEAMGSNQSNEDTTINEIVRNNNTTIINQESQNQEIQQQSVAQSNNSEQQSEQNNTTQEETQPQAETPQQPIQQSSENKENKSREAVAQNQNTTNHKRGVNMKRGGKPSSKPSAPVSMDDDYYAAMADEQDQIFNNAEAGIRDKMQGGDTITLGMLLSNIGKNSQLAALANNLLSKLGELKGLQVRVVPRIEGNAYGENTRVAGLYNPEDNTITISAAECFHSNYAFDATVLHETMHAIVHNTEIDGQKRFEFNKLFREIKDSILKKYGVKSLDELEGTKVYRRLYGLNNPDEFISEIFINSDFAVEIDSVEKSFFDRFVEWLFDLLNLPMSKVAKKQVSDILLDFKGKELSREERKGISIKENDNWIDKAINTAIEKHSFTQSAREFARKLVKAASESGTIDSLISKIQNINQYENKEDLVDFIKAAYNTINNNELDGFEDSDIVERYYDSEFNNILDTNMKSIQQIFEMFKDPDFVVLIQKESKENLASNPNVQTELNQIKEQSIANGTFMKAPNGNPTNLTERQWLQVRTKAFKEWFGDWEKLAPKLQISDDKKLQDILQNIANSNSRFSTLAKFIIDNHLSPRDLGEVLIDKDYPLGNQQGWYSEVNDPQVGIIRYIGFQANNVPEETFNGAILHEVIHSLTQRLLRNYKNNPNSVPDNIRASIQDLYNIIDYAKKYIQDNYNVKEDSDRQKLINLVNRQNFDKGYLHKMFYAFDKASNPESEHIDEFISEIFTNPAFQEMLNSIPYKETKQTLWDKIKECIQNIFGIPINKGSVLEEALKSSTEFITKAKKEYDSVSKVVDENGEPLVVYHYTDNENLNEFSVDFDNYFAQTGGTKKAIFFTEDKVEKGEEDNFLTQRKARKSVFLNIKDLKTYNGTKEDLHKKGTSYREVVNKSAEENDVDGGVHMSGFDDNKKTNQDIWIIHNPNQVKSATDNVGSFSQENNDIRYSAGFDNTNKSNNFASIIKENSNKCK